MPPLTIANDVFLLEVQAQERSLSAILSNRKTGWSSGSVPLVRLEVRDRMQERVESVQAYSILQTECRDGSIHAVIRDRERGVTIGLWFTLAEDGSLSILVPPSEIEESDDLLYRIESTEVLPGLMKADAEGNILIPVNTGVLCSPRGKPRIRDRFLVYGEQERWELVPTLPVCGVITAQGGLVAIATQGACDMYCEVATDGEGNGSVGLYPMFRRSWIDPVDWTQREIRISMVAPGEDLVLRAARELRRHVVQDLGKKSLRQRASESPVCAYQQGAYTMKLFHGIQRQGIMMNGRSDEGSGLLFKRTMSFSDAARNFQLLKEAGVDRIYFQSVGWNPKGHDGAWPTLFPIEQRVGGEAGLRRMIAAAKSLGYQITTHLNCSCSFFKSPDFRPDYVIQDAWNEPKVTGFWGGGVNGKHWGLAFPDGYLETRMKALRELGFNGMQYLDGIGNPLYVNYHKVHGGPRRDHAAGINRFLDTACDVFGGVESEMGFLYCALHADAVSTGGSAWQLALCKSAWPVTGLLDERVPVWQLALHGLVTHENTGVAWKDTMRAILFGEVPRDEWSSEPGVMPVLDQARIARIKARYDLCCVKYGHLVAEEMVGWRRVAADVEESRFADGTVVVADFGAARLTVNGEPVPAHNGPTG